MEAKVRAWTNADETIRVEFRPDVKHDEETGEIVEVLPHGELVLNEPGVSSHTLTFCDEDYISDAISDFYPNDTFTEVTGSETP